MSRRRISQRMRNIAGLEQAVRIEFHCGPLAAEQYVERWIATDSVLDAALDSNGDQKKLDSLWGELAHMKGRS